MMNSHGRTMYGYSSITVLECFSKEEQCFKGTKVQGHTMATFVTRKF
jgi:hypothetical protein